LASALDGGFTVSRLNWPWIGIFGGAALWYGAHDLGFYFSDYNCRHTWILPTIHVLFFLACLICAGLSFRIWRRGDREAVRTWVAGIGVAAAFLFSLVILWQGIATFIYSGCER
jgi:uncharacterized membrane protein